MIKNILKISAIISIFVLGAVAQTNGIASKQWKLTSLNGTAVKDSKAFIVIDSASGRFSGNAGCNRMFGAVKIDGKSISFSGVGTTRMACPADGAMKLESGFTEALAKVTRYSVGGGVLNFYRGDRRILRFAISKDEPETKPAAGLKLQDKKWVLEWIGDKPAGELGSQAFISFHPDNGSAGGSTSCNAYGGNYTLKERFLTIRQVISTMRACVEDERMQIERSFLDGLQRTDRYEIRGAKLYLYNGATLLLTFRGEVKE